MVEQLEIEARYAGYLARQDADIAALRAEEAFELPRDLDLEAIAGLSSEIRARLAEVRPGDARRGRAPAGDDAGGAGGPLSLRPAGGLSDGRAAARPRGLRGDGSMFHVKHWSGSALYLELLARWQRAINLVGPATLADPWRRHILDSAQLMAHLPARRPLGRRPRQRRRLSRAWSWRSWACRTWR